MVSVGGKLEDGSQAKSQCFDTRTAEWFDYKEIAEQQSDENQSKINSISKSLS
jgi:hypothetical protein